MTATQSRIFTIHQPSEDLVGDTHIDFLKNLDGPTWITIDGQDNSRYRAIVTLMHGNEPSGLKAIHALLKSGVIPATKLGIMIAAVDAARYPPLLSHRFIPGEHDLNRCFGKGADSQHQLAERIVETITRFNPEVVIDCHNTSSHSEPFSIAIRHTENLDQLASLFTDNLIIMDQRLGTLMDGLPIHTPALTVEFGGFMDPNADWLARESLHRFAVSHVLEGGKESPVNLLMHPFRLETRHHLTVTYSSSIDEDADLTMVNTIDQLNFRRIEPGTTLGWFREKEHNNLVTNDGHGNDDFFNHFTQDDGLLTSSVPMTLFMATTDPVVANTDCLLYYVPDI